MGRDTLLESVSDSELKIGKLCRCRLALGFIDWVAVAAGPAPTLTDGH